MTLAGPQPSLSVTDTADFDHMESWASSGFSSEQQLHLASQLKSFHEDRAAYFSSLELFLSVQAGSMKVSAALALALDEMIAHQRATKSSNPVAHPSWRKLSPKLCKRIDKRLEFHARMAALWRSLAYRFLAEKTGRRAA
jgi:hypothetical protein